MCPFQVQLLSHIWNRQRNSRHIGLPAAPRHRDGVHNDPGPAEGEAGPTGARIGREAPLPQV